MSTELFLKGRLRNDLTAEETKALEGAIERRVTVPPRTRVIEAGERLEQSFYLVEGTMLRYIESPSGDRQVVQINLPGDFVDLHGYPTKRLDHDVGSLGECELAIFPHRALTSLFEHHQHLARAMWFSTLLDAAMHREWIRVMGCLNAEARLAHLVCELAERLRIIGRFDGREIALPLLQRDYADACGITDVHANRSFRTLQERGFLSVHRLGPLEIHDLAGLQRLAGFGGAYLYGEGALKLQALDDR